MIKSMNWKEIFPDFEPPLLLEMEHFAVINNFAEDDVLIDIGEPVVFVPLLLEGYVKIIREDKNDGEHLLYYLEKGAVCALSISCCFDHKKSEIKAIAETSGRVAKIPLGKMDEWMARFSGFRNFVLQSYNRRLQEMLVAIDSLAFLNLEERIVKYLRDKKQINDSRFIETTHQEMAADLNTSRVVVSRLLKKMEADKKIKINRKSIEFLD